MKEGNVVLTAIIQADGQIKRRPAIMLREMPLYGDFLVCGVSTQLHQEIQGFDEIIAQRDEDFSASGLRAESLIRLGFLALLPVKNIEGTIGAISPQRHKRLLKRLSGYLIGRKSVRK